MKRKLTLLIIIILTSYSMYGQICGTTSIGAVSYSRETAANASFLNSSNPIYINVFFHIVRNTNGTNVFTPPDLGTVISNLNTYYSSHNITFRNAGSEFINNTSFVNIDGKEPEATRLGQVNNRSNAINYYIVESLWDVYLNGIYQGYVTGIANSITSNNLVIRNDRVLTSTSPHELGHCLNLLHTHDTMKGIEAINGSNCSSAGDEICDTPADPGLSVGNVNPSCTYTGGGGYNPLTNNIMSYSRVFCLTNFTNGQANRMRLALACSSLLQKVVVVPELSSIKTLCFSNSKTLAMNIDSNTTTWQVSSNISILSKNNTSITVRASYSSSTGNGWVKATLSNGVVLKEEFEVGTPQSSLMAFNRYASYDFKSFRWNLLGTHYNGVLTFDNKYQWEWQVPSSMLRYSSSYSYINFRPTLNRSTRIYIRTRASNECGCSDWYGQWFNVVYRSNDPCRDSTGNPCADNIIEY